MRSLRIWLPLLVVLVGLGGYFLARGSQPASILDPPRAPVSYRGPAHRSIFVILIDTVRADRLSCYGCTAFQTPHADRLAAEGVRFDNAWSVASWTRPSVAALFTSLYPTQLGLVERPGPQGKQWKGRERREQLSTDLPEDETTLAEALRAGGFSTGAFVNQPALNNQHGFLQGFDEWYYPSSMERISRLDPASTTTVQSWLSTKYADTADALLADAFDIWLADHSADEKVFAYVHLLTPHRPYLPKAPYAPSVKGRRATLSELYDGEIQMADALLGRILDSIEARRGDEGSLIVLLSDHGEEFMDHGMMEHGHSLHREVTRIPLILRSTDLPQGRVIEEAVRTIDLMPTLLELAGLETKGAMGVSLWPLMEGRKLDLPVYSEAMLYGSTKRALIDGALRILYDSQGTHWKLYDLRNDPGETLDISSNDPAELENLRRELETVYRGLNRDYLDRLGHYKHRISPEEERQNARRAKEALKALGYID